MRTKLLKEIRRKYAIRVMGKYWLVYRRKDMLFDQRYSNSTSMVYDLCVTNHMITAIDWLIRKRRMYDERDAIKQASHDLSNRRNLD